MKLHLVDSVDPIHWEDSANHLFQKGFVTAGKWYFDGFSVNKGQIAENIIICRVGSGWILQRQSISRIERPSRIFVWGIPNLLQLQTRVLHDFQKIISVLLRVFFDVIRFRNTSRSQYNHSIPSRFVTSLKSEMLTFGWVVVKEKVRVLSLFSWFFAHWFARWFAQIFASVWKIKYLVPECEQINCNSESYNAKSF